VKRFALLLLFATTAFGAAEPDVALTRFLPALPKRLESGCWSARAEVLKLRSAPKSGELDAFDGERRVFHGSASATRLDRADDIYALTWSVPAACSGNATALRLRYRLTIRTNAGKAIVVRAEDDEFSELREPPPIGVFRPPPPPPYEERSENHRCDVAWAKEPELPLKLAANDAVTACRVSDGKGAGPFHGMRIISEKQVPPQLAAKIISVLNDGRTYACTGMGCIHVGMAFRIGGRDLGICLECHYLHDLASNRRAPLSDQGVKELTEIYNALFK